MDFHACTIIARNYLAAARVLARSFVHQHPNSKFSVLVVDQEPDATDSEPFAILGLGDLCLERDEVLRMAAIYDVTELCTAVKPWLLERLLDDGDPVAIYLDPDTRVYSPLDASAELAFEHGIVLTPHVTRPIPRDGLRMSEAEILSAGIYNLGFIAVSAEARGFLSFWKERLRRDCVDDRANMCFVDQRWVDFVPALYSAHILRDPGYNVAYWNVDQRELWFEGNQYFVNDVHLRFFHFSGYDPNKPYLLSKHQGEQPRVLLSERPDLTRICEEYRNELLAQGYNQIRQLAYGFAALPNGKPYSRFMRRLYRAALIASENNGTSLPPNPLEAGSSFSFFRWLNEPPTEKPGSRLSRYLWTTYQDRADLQLAFPDPEGADFVNFTAWAQHEAQHGSLDPALAPSPRPSPVGRTASVAPEGQLAPISGPLAPPQPAEGAVGLSPPSPGIRVVGYLNAESGVGEQGRLAFAASHFAGIPTSACIDTTTPSRQTQPFDASAEDFNLNLVCVNADQLPSFARRVGQNFFSNHYTVGLWAWELEEFPERFAGAFDYVDEVWADSEFCRKAIARIASKPVYAFPLPILEPEESIEFDLSDFRVSDGYRFLFCFDLLSVFERKNPLAVIEAFDKAFRPNEGPILVLKATNGELAKMSLEHLRWAAARRPDVVLIDGYLDRSSNDSLMAACDCYVSLHRSEGFGLTLGEAMALGKPVIATGYSGNLDFMTPDNSYLVPYRLTEVPEGCYPYPAGALWAEPDIQAAAQLMREAYENPSAAAEVGRRARYHVRASHGLAARSRFITERFATAQAELARRGPRNSSDSADGLRDSGLSLVDFAVTRPPLLAPSRHPGAARVFRRFIGRALQSHDDHQREINARLAEGVERSLAEVRDAAEEVRVLREQLESLRDQQHPS